MDFMGSSTPEHSGREGWDKFNKTKFVRSSSSLYVYIPCIKYIIEFNNE